MYTLSRMEDWIVLNTFEFFEIFEGFHDHFWNLICVHLIVSSYFFVHHLHSPSNCLGHLGVFVLKTRPGYKCPFTAWRLMIGVQCQLVFWGGHIFAAYDTMVNIDVTLKFLTWFSFKE